MIVKPSITLHSQDKATSIETDYIMPMRREVSRCEPCAIGITGPIEVPRLAQRLWLAIKRAWIHA